MSGEENRQLRKEIIYSMGGLVLLFGSVLGPESNMQALNNHRIEDTSFSKYLEVGRKRQGDNIGTTLFALWTYPCARLGAAIHNYRLPK